MRSRGRRDERVTYLWADLKQSVRVYSARTAQTSAAYLTPCLQPGMSLIDLGCGPGSVTADLADLVAPGRVVGIDISPKMIRRARDAAAGRSVANLSFAVADALSLPVPDGCFDVVHCHQLLLHVPDPVGVLREMRRAAVPGGLVAARAGDIEAIVFFPDCPEAACDWPFCGGKPGSRARVLPPRPGVPLVSGACSCCGWGLAAIAALRRVAARLASGLAAGRCESFGIKFVTDLARGDTSAAWPGTPMWAVVAVAVVLLSVCEARTTLLLKPRRSVAAMLRVERRPRVSR